MAAAGGVAAALAASVARISPVSAADGDPVTVGKNVTGTKKTSVTNNDNDDTAFAGHSAKGIGVLGTSKDKAGVSGQSESAAGVGGTSTGGAGVHGSSNGGSGVLASSFSGHGVEASSMNGYALATTEGGVQFKGLSGVATISSGDTKVKVRPLALISSKTFVLVSPESNIESRALWATKLTDSGEIEIHLSASRSNDTKVAWIVFDHAGN